MSDAFQTGLQATIASLQAAKLRPGTVTATRSRLKKLAAPPSPPPRDATPKPPSDRAAPTATPSQFSRYKTLEELREAALECVRCPHLVAARTHVVFGAGNPHAELMFVGEAPGADEDEQGEPFVGRAGQMLTKIITAMGFTREEVYIGNVLKCRPDMPTGRSGNRKPRPEEMRACLPWLERQIELIGPKVLVALGATAIEGLLGIAEPIGGLRGRWLEFHGIALMPTYHPAYLLRNQSLTEKRKVWEDMLKVLEKLGRPVSEKQRRFFTAAG